MLQLIKDILSVIKTGVDCYIIWIIGPDNILFDLQSILAIIISGIALLISFGSLIWKLSRRT